MSKLTTECIAERIKLIKDNLKYERVTMKGFNDDLLRIKSELERIFDDNFFYLGYTLGDAPYHGWRGKKLDDMHNINQDLQKKFYEMYAIILKATNSEIE